MRLEKQDLEAKRAATSARVGRRPPEAERVTPASLPAGLQRHGLPGHSSAASLQQAAVLDMKTPTGSMRVSNPETTVVDLIRFAKAAGHLDHAASVIGQLAPSLSPTRLVAALAVVHDIPNTQRLGYILDSLQQRNLAGRVHRWVERRIERFRPLRPGRLVEHAHENRRWHLRINGPLEIES